MKQLFCKILFVLFAINTSAQIIKKPIPDKLVVLTFDDGVKTHSTVVAPLLKKYGFGATFFVCEFPPNFSDTTKYMSWEEMKQLGTMGFEVANHTRTHKHVNRINKETFVGELEYIEDTCVALGLPTPSTFAYPGYDIHPMATETLKEKGYLFARTGGDRPYDPTTDHPYLIPSFTTTKTNKQQILEALSQAKNGKVVVLTIHGVPDYEHDWVTTPTEYFVEYLEFLKKNNFKVIALKDLSRYINVERAINSIAPNYQVKIK